jgi:hypothetical protein
MRLRIRSISVCGTTEDEIACEWNIPLLSLAPQPSLGLGLLHKIRLNFVEASQQFSFLQVRVFSPTPNPHPGGPGLYIYIPQRQSRYPFYSPLTTRMSYGGTILIPRSPHGENGGLVMEKKKNVK